MPRERSPQRDQAFAIFQEHGGNIANREIAKQLGIPEKSVGGWKVKDRWTDRLNGVLQTGERSTPKGRGGAPKGSKNALGNRGGHGGPVGNSKAVTHGFYQRILPNDDATLALFEEIGEMNPLDILWHNITIQFAAIVRAQRIMFVRDQEDETKVTKRVRQSEMSSETEWEYQHAWDKQANFLQAQSRAMATLEGLLERYEEMLPKGVRMEKRHLELEKLRSDIEHVKNPQGGDAEAWASTVEEIAQERERKRSGPSE